MKVASIAITAFVASAKLKDVTSFQFSSKALPSHLFSTSTSSSMRRSHATTMDDIRSNATDSTILSIPENLLKLSDIMKQSRETEAAEERSNKGKSNIQVKVPEEEQQQQESYASSSSPSSPSSPILENEPWCADYDTSRRTQKKIQNAAKIRASPIQRATSVLQLLLKTPPALCNPSNLVCALTLSAKIVPKHCQYNQRRQFRHLLLQTLDILHDLVRAQELNTRQLANAAWAIAKHYSVDEELLPQYFDSGYMNIGGSDTSMMSQTWDLDADEKYESEQQVMKTLDHIAMQLTDNMAGIKKPGRKQINEVEMSMICWAYAIVYPRNTPAGWELPPRLSKMEGNSLSKMNGNGNDFGEMITFETFQDGTLGNTVEEDDYATFKPSSIVDKLFDAIAVSIVRPKKKGPSMIYKCQWKELSTITWSFANRGYCESNAAMNLILNLANEAIARIERETLSGVEDSKILPRDLSEIAWALGVMQSDNYYLADSLENFVDAVADNIASRGQARPLANWMSADCLQMAVALAHGRLDRQILLEQIYMEALRSIRHDVNGQNSKNMRGHNNHKSFQDFELVILLWVQARLYLTADVSDVFDEFAEIFPRTLLSRMEVDGTTQSPREAFKRINLGAQEQANIAWSLTVLEKYESKEAIELLSRIFKLCSESCKDGINVEHAHQLWQSIFILQDNCPEAVESIDDQTFDFLKGIWDQEKTRRKTSSQRHKALSETLDLMGVQHYNEHDEDIDVALVLQTESSWTQSAVKSDEAGEDKYNQRVAVEFDGPSHFTKIAIPRPGVKVDPPRTLGHTVLKYKLLKKQGWTFVRIPFYEFDRIPFWASMERQRYVQRKLKTHASIRFSGADVSEYKSPVPNKKSRFD